MNKEIIKEELQKLAMEWWIILSFKKQKELRDKYYKGIILPSLSKENILKIYQKTHPDQSNETPKDSWDDVEFLCKDKKECGFPNCDCQMSNVMPTDTEMLNWLQSIMTPKNNYCEIFFAGLRGSIDDDAKYFQIECNPEKFETQQGNSIRESIWLAMKNYKK